MASFLESREALPVLGVGASLSFGMEPDPVALAAAPGGPSFIEYAGATDPGPVREPVARLARRGVPVLYHPSCLNLCGPTPNPPAWVDAVRAHVEAVRSPWLAQDVAVCFSGPTPGYSIQLGYFVPPILTADALDEAAARVAEVTARCHVPLLLEPPPVTFRLGDMDPWAWLAALAERTDCGLLLDAGHVVAHQLTLERGLLDGLDALDWGRVTELHVAGGFIQRREGRGYYVDAHDLPALPEAWQVARHVLGKAPQLRAVCVECEGTAAAAVLPALRRARERVAMSACNPALRERARAELVGGDGEGELLP